MTDKEQSPQWGKMNNSEFVDYTRTMMEKVFQHIVDDLDNWDAVEIQKQYSTPAKFAQVVLDDAKADEALR